MIDAKASENSIARCPDGDERLGGGGCFLGKTVVCTKPTAKRMLSSAGEWSPNGDAD